MDAAADSASTRLPLRVAVVRHPLGGSGDEPGAPFDEAIELFCEQALGLDAGRFKIEFDRNLRCFDVLEFLDIWDEEESRRGTRLRGIFDIGDGSLSPILEVDEKDTLAPRINAAICRLYSLLEASLKGASNAGRLQIWAKPESLAKPLSVIPAYLFAKYTITDWFNGNAEANGGPRLFDIHLDLAPEEVTRHEGSSEKRATKLLAGALLEKPDLTKKEGKTILTDAKITVSNRRFNLGVWPNAREEANLPAKAPAGRKRRNHSA